MRSDPPAKICVFGDSNIASVRKALDAGLIDFGDASVEFWGAGGARFRDLHLQGDIVVPGQQAAPVVAQVNGLGREVLDPREFDLVIFYGARLSASEFIARAVQTAADDGWPSLAVQQAMARGWLENCRAFRFARAFAPLVPAWFVPAPFPTDGVRDYRVKGRIFANAPAAEATSLSQRDRLWRLAIETAAQDDVRLIRQPENTVVRGLLTAACYAVDGAKDNRDNGHKSPEYAALVLNTAFQASDWGAGHSIAAQ